MKKLMILLFPLCVMVGVHAMKKTYSIQKNAFVENNYTDTMPPMRDSLPKKSKPWKKNYDSTYKRKDTIY